MNVVATLLFIGSIISCSAPFASGQESPESSGVGNFVLGFALLVLAAICLGIHDARERGKRIQKFLEDPDDFFKPGGKR